jgi:hypothetical protein
LVRLPEYKGCCLGPLEEEGKHLYRWSGRSNELPNPARNVKTFPVSAHETHVNVIYVDAVVFHPVRRRCVGCHVWTARGNLSKSVPISVSEDAVVVAGVVSAAQSNTNSISITLFVSGFLGTTLYSDPDFGPLLVSFVGVGIPSMSLWLALLKMSMLSLGLVCDMGTACLSYIPMSVGCLVRVF